MTPFRCPVILGTSGVLWNGFGRIVPVLIAVAVTPLLLHRLGTERWGLLALSVVA
jgi:hypothetical protein